MTNFHAFLGGIAIAYAVPGGLYFVWKGVKAGGTSLLQKFIDHIKAEIEKKVTVA